MIALSQSMQVSSAEDRLKVWSWHSTPCVLRSFVSLISHRDFPSIHGYRRISCHTLGGQTRQEARSALHVFLFICSIADIFNSLTRVQFYSSKRISSNNSSSIVILSKNPFVQQFLVHMIFVHKHFGPVWLCPKIFRPQCFGHTYLVQIDLVQKLFV